MTDVFFSSTEYEYTEWEHAFADAEPATGFLRNHPRN